MAPLNSVQSLFDLSFTTSRDQIMSAMKTIENRYPCDKRLSFDVPGCSAEVQTLQDFLKDLLPATLSEKLLLDIVNQFMCLDFSILHDIYVWDERIIYATFIYEGVNLETLVLGNCDIRNIDSAPHFAGLTDDDPEHEILRNQRLIDFWMKRVPMLTKLVKIDMTGVRHTEIFLSFIRTCTKLRTIKSFMFDISASILVTLLRTSTHLQSLQRCTFYENDIEEVFTPLGKDLKLKLRNISLFRPNADQVNLVLDVCPLLNDLEFFTGLDNYHDVMDILATSSLKLSRFILPYYEDDTEIFNHFFTCKGVYITCLHISRFNLGNPVEEIRVISDTCKNITELYLESDWMPEESFSNQGDVHGISFPKLQKLTISNRFELNGIVGLIALVNLCTMNSTNLTELEVICGMDFTGAHATLGVDAALVKLFETTPRLRQLTRLKLICSEGPISALLGRTVYEKCPNLTYLFVRRLSDDARLYFENVRSIAKTNNLNLCLYT